LSSELAELERKKAESNRARQQLKRFHVLRARANIEKGRFRDQWINEVVVKNGTDRAVSRAYFRGTLQTAGRAIPWLREKFNYEIKGGLESGEQAEWKLVPNTFGARGSVEEKPNMAYNVEVIGLDGPDGKPFLRADFDDDDQKRLDALKKASGEAQ
jgi:hypothetical protein